MRLFPNVRIKPSAYSLFQQDFLLNNFLLRYGTYYTHNIVVLFFPQREKEIQETEMGEERLMRDRDNGGWGI
jgi:hypothetical protein